MNVEALADRHLAEPSFFVPSDELLVRLVSAYQSTQTSTGENGKIWQSIAGKQNELHAALLSGNIGLLRKLLSDPGKTYLYYGVDNLFPDVITVLTGSESARR